MTTLEQVDAATQRLSDRLSGEALEDLRWLAALARTAVPSGHVMEDARRLRALVDIAAPRLEHEADIARVDRLAAGAQRAEANAKAAETWAMCGAAERERDIERARAKRASEAMRAACLEAVRSRLEEMGYDQTSHMQAMLRADIEGAEP